MHSSVWVTTEIKRNCDPSLNLHASFEIQMYWLGTWAQEINNFVVLPYHNMVTPLQRCSTQSFNIYSYIQNTYNKHIKTGP